MFQLALPTIAAQLINMLYNIVDRIYIGHMPEIGDLALTGVGVCMPLIMVVSAFAALISTGGAPRASIFLGQGDHESAERTMGSCFSLQVIVSVILTIILLFGNRYFLMAFGGRENTIGFATDYMGIYALGTIFVQLTLGMNAYITAQGFSKISMMTVLIGAICNIILDPIFIFGLGLGVRGAALATILAACMRKLVLPIPLIFIMPMLMENKTMAVYTAEPVADVLAVAFTSTLFAVQFKKALKKISE